MNANEKSRREERLVGRLRIAEDCLQRALDQLEDAGKSDVAWEYVKRQVDMAHDSVIDAQGVVGVLFRGPAM